MFAVPDNMPIEHVAWNQGYHARQQGWAREVAFNLEWELRRWWRLGWAACDANIKAGRPA